VRPVAEICPLLKDMVSEAELAQTGA